MEIIIYYPCYCHDCRHYWYVKNREGKETCPKCHSENTNKGIKDSMKPCPDCPLARKCIVTVVKKKKKPAGRIVNCGVSKTKKKGG
jgi:hypothetical protein